MSHVSNLSDGEVNAGFMFIRKPAVQLTNGVIKQIMQYAFAQQGVPGNLLYSEYIVLAENNGTASDADIPFTWEHPKFPGRTYRSSIDSLRFVDSVRRDHERNRKPGQESTRPKRKFLTSNTLVIVIGSARFLGEHLRYYLEDEGLVREVVIDMLLGFMSLPVWKPEVGHDAFSFLKPAELPGYKFYQDYFNAFLDHITPKEEDTRMSTAELVSKLG